MMLYEMSAFYSVVPILEHSMVASFVFSHTSILVHPCEAPLYTLEMSGCFFSGKQKVFLKHKQLLVKKVWFYTYIRLLQTS